MRETNAVHEQVDRLLHDAEHAESGARMAKMMVGRISSAAEDAARLDAEARTLLTEANRLDPEHAAPAWRDTTLSLAKQT